jgi:hypothetical protein
VGAIGAGGVFSASVAAGTLAKVVGSSLLTGLLTGASAYGQIQAGNMQADILNMQARQSELSARQETLKGRQTALAIRKDLERTLAGQNATFAARGVLQGEGSAAAAAEASSKNAADDIDLATFGAAMASESEKLEAAQYRAKGQSAKTAGRVNAVNTVTSYRPVASLLEGL